MAMVTPIVTNLADQHDHQASPSPQQAQWLWSCSTPGSRRTAGWADRTAAVASSVCPRASTSRACRRGPASPPCPPWWRPTTSRSTSPAPTRRRRRRTPLVTTISLSELGLGRWSFVVVVVCLLVGWLVGWLLNATATC